MILEGLESDWVVISCRRCDGQGQMKTTTGGETTECDVCGGNRTVRVDDPLDARECSTCSGDGEVVSDEMSVAGDHGAVNTCPACDGVGLVAEEDNDGNENERGLE